MRDGRPSRSSRDQLSARGVALPYTATAPSIAARLAATVRASYRGSDSCLNDASCSSSTTTRPRRATGAKIADRAPTTTGAAPGRDPRALVAALRLGQPRVENRDPIAEACTKASDGLRRQRDLRDEHDDGAPPLERCGRRLQIDLGLPASGRPMEQNVTSRAVERSHDPRDSVALFRRQLVRFGLADEPAADGSRGGPRRVRACGATSASARAGVDP